MEDDKVKITAHEGEYVLPADVVQYLGLEKIRTLHNKAIEGMGKLEEEGKVGGEGDEEPEFLTGGFIGDQQEEDFYQTTPFNPADWMTPGSTYFTPSTPSTPGEQEYRTYTNAQGQVISILFIDGKPQQSIPPGYTPAGAEPSAADKLFKDRERDDNIAENIPSYERNPNQNYYGMSSEELLRPLDNNILGDLTSFLPGLAGGALSSVFRSAKINDLRARAIVSRDLGRIEDAERLEAEAAELEAQGNQNRIGGIIGSIIGTQNGVGLANRQKTAAERLGLDTTGGADDDEAPGSEGADRGFLGDRSTSSEGDKRDVGKSGIDSSRERDDSGKSRVGSNHERDDTVKTGQTSTESSPTEKGSQSYGNQTSPASSPSGKGDQYSSQKDQESKPTSTGGGTTMAYRKGGLIKRRSKSKG